MSLPVSRPFSADIEVRFPDAMDVPPEMEEWCAVTKENLDRLREKVLILEGTDIATLQAKVKKLEKKLEELS